MTNEIGPKEFFDLFENCPLCITFTYTDSEGNVRIVFDPCEFHNPFNQPL